MTYLPAAPLPGGRPNGLRSHPSSASRVSKLSHASTITPSGSPSARDRTVSPLSGFSTPRSDSPALGISPLTSRVISGSSTINTVPARTRTSQLIDPFGNDDEQKSDHDSVEFAQDRRRSVAGPGNYISGPVSPPTPARDEEREEWLTAESEASLLGSPGRKARLVLGITSKGVGGRRKSVFVEKLDES